MSSSQLAADLDDAIAALKLTVGRVRLGDVVEWTFNNLQEAHRVLRMVNATNEELLRIKRK